MRTSELLQLLSQRYQPPSGAFIPEFVAGTGAYSNSRADALAMELWESNGWEIHGFELKVSRADWLRELKVWNTEKATPVKRFCDRWYVVAANSKIVKYADELPRGWGLMFAEDDKDGGKRLHTMIEAPKLTPEPYGRHFIASLMRRATRVDGLAHIVPPHEQRF